MREGYKKGEKEERKIDNVRDEAKQNPVLLYF